LLLDNCDALESESPLPLLTPETEAAASATDTFARMLASGYARAGAIDSALHWLEVAIERGFINYPFLARWDPSLEPLRDEPRFLRLMALVRQRCERFEK
jgi:non-specific serine/threonine protein kinase